MKSFITPFKVGLLMIAGFLAFAYMFGSVGTSLMSDNEGYQVEVYLSDATGLSEQSRVMMAGIAVGVIDSVELAGTEARVTLRIQDDIALVEGEQRPGVDGPEFYDGASITRRQASLLGDYFLELSPGIRGPVLDNGDRIQIVIEPAGPGQIMEQMAVVGSNLERISLDVANITETFSQVFGGDEGVQKLDEIIEDIQSMVAALENIATSNETSLSNIVNNIEAISEDVRGFTSTTGRSVDGILADVSAMTSELRYVVGQSSGDVAEGLGTMRSTLSSLQLALDNLNYSLENVQEITDRVADGEGTLGALVNDSAISDETERLLANANDVIEGFTGLETWVEMRSEYGLEGHTFKNYLTVTLRPSIDKFYIIELVDDPRGSTETTQTFITSSDPNEPPFRFEEVSETTNSFKISVLFGGRWAIGDLFWVGARWGLIESTGGVGANLWAFDDHLELRFDVFDFGQNENVRLRAATLLNLGMFASENSLLNYIFLQAGVDDIINPIPRDFFLGGGVSFNDRDLRNLLMVAPSP